MKNELETLKERFLSATTEQEYDAIRKEMRALCDRDTAGVALETLQDIKRTNSKLAAEIFPKKPRRSGLSAERYQL